MSSMPAVTRSRRDRCPGVLRPWLADDGALVRIRVPGGAISTAALSGLVEAAHQFGDGRIYLTSRANIQIRGVDGQDELDALGTRIRSLGLLPSPAHDRVRNIMASPLSGRAGGRADMRPIIEELDAGLCGDELFTALPGRFLFAFDDGRGDLLDRDVDFGLVAVDSSHGQVRLGSTAWGPVIELAHGASVLLDLARAFIQLRGDTPDAPWHVNELTTEQLHRLANVTERDQRTRIASDPPAYATIQQDDGLWYTHLPVPDGALTSAHNALARAGEHVIVTPWRSLLLPDLTSAH